MKAIIIAIMALVMVAIVARPSRAQSERCWNKIAGCAADVDDGQQSQCCPVLREQVINDTKCFCGIGSLLDPDSSTMKSISTFLSTCEIAPSFYSVCPNVNTRPPSTPIQPSPSKDASPEPPTTSSTSPPLHDQVPESNNPYPSSPPKPDSISTPSQGLLVRVFGPVGAAIFVIGLILIIYCPKKAFGFICGPGDKANANANNDDNPPPPPPPPPPAVNNNK